MNKSITIKISIFAFAFLSLTSCTSPYKPMGLNGGYSEVPINDDSYRITFSGNSYTSPDVTQNYALRRAAELTLNNGYKYFIVLDNNIAENRQLVHTPTTIESNTVHYHHHSSTYTTVEPGSNYTIKRYKSLITIKMLHNNIQYHNAFNAMKILNNYSAQN